MEKMKDVDWKMIIKYGSFSIVSVACLFGISILLNSVSCVSVPKSIDNEPLICEKSSQWAYLAIMDKSGKFPESVSTSGVYSCVDTLKVDTCNDQRNKYLKENPWTKDRYTDLQISTQARKIYDQCKSDLKR
jgi:hypothetical protein